MNAHEHGLLTFLAANAGRRALALFEGGPKRRVKLTASFDHDLVLADDFARRLDGTAATADAVAHILIEHGAPTSCHVMSADPRVDGRSMPLRDALVAVVGQGFGSFVSCVPGRLAFFEYEDGRRYLLAREP